MSEETARGVADMVAVVDEAVIWLVGGTLTREFKPGPRFGPSLCDGYQPAHVASDRGCQMYKVVGTYPTGVGVGELGMCG